MNLSFFLKKKSYSKKNNLFKSWFPFLVVNPYSVGACEDYLSLQTRSHTHKNASDD